MKLLSFNDILNLQPCKEHHPSKYISTTWTGTAIDVLKLPNVAYSEKIWVARQVISVKVL